MTKTELLYMLTDGVTSVKFIKADGSERKMKCTLNTKFIREDLLPKATSKVVSLPEHLIRVYDVEKEAWRTINIDTLF